MHRIDAPGNLAGFFTEGDPQLGIPPTTVSDAWLNDVQENLVDTIESASIALVKGDYTQLRRAIERIARKTTCFRNLLINGDFQITQDSIGGASSTGAAVYAIDGWIVDRNGSGSFGAIPTRWQGGTTLAPTNPPAILTLHNPGNASGNASLLRQRIADVRTLAGQDATLSFWARVKTTPMPSTVANLKPKLRQYHGAGGSPASDVTLTGTDFAITTTWARFTYTFTVPTPGAIGTTGYPGLTLQGTTLAEMETLHYLELEFELDDWDGIGVDVELVDVQLEAGSSASDFERRPFAVELALCQRYYEKSLEPFMSAAALAAGAPYFEGSSSGYDAGLVARGLRTRFRVTKVRRPTITWLSPNTGAAANLYWEGADRAVTGTNYPSTDGTGEPVVGAARAASASYGHWIADARL